MPHRTAGLSEKISKPQGNNRTCWGVFLPEARPGGLHLQVLSCKSPLHMVGQPAQLQEDCAGFFTYSDAAG